jgi:hypothetical protein
MLAEEWDSFARTVLPKDCSFEQRQDMRQAFYAGATSILAILIETKGNANNLIAELRDFSQAVVEGRA